MAFEPNRPAVTTELERFLNTNAQNNLEDTYLELKASLNLSDGPTRDGAQRHLMEKMLLTASEDRTGHTAAGFIGHPVLSQGFIASLQHMVCSELAATVNGRILARVLPLAHRLPRDHEAWFIVGE
jgi:hypothetical protein